jgi:hypothetical protein
MTRVSAVLALVLATSTASTIEDEIILEWSSGLIYRWYCLGQKEELKVEDEKMTKGIDRTKAAYFLTAMKIQWSKQPEEFCGAMRCGQTGVCD